MSFANYRIPELLPGWMLQLRTLVSILKQPQGWALNKEQLFSIWTSSDIVGKRSIFPEIQQRDFPSPKYCFVTMCVCEIHPPPQFLRQKSRWIEGKPPLFKVSDVIVYTKSSRIALEYVRFTLIKRIVSTSGFRKRVPDFSSTVKVTK